MVTVFAIIAVGVIVGFLVHKIAKHQAYSVLKSSVASQTFANRLSAPSYTSRECYSSEGQDYCPALVYILTNESCELLNTALQKAGCDNEYAQEVIVYKGKPITYKVAEFKQNKVLEVYINQVSHLY